MKLEVFESSRGYFLGYECKDGRIEAPLTGVRGGVYAYQSRSADDIGSHPQVRKYTTLRGARAAAKRRGGDE